MSEGAMTFQVDLSNCDREPIHLSGAIQPHGVLFVLSIPGLAILQQSANAGQVFGAAAGPGRPIGELLDGDCVTALAQLAHDSSPAHATLIKTQALHGGALFDAIARRIPEGLLVELEPATSPESLSFNDFYLRARTAVARLQAFTEIGALCRAAVVEVRAMTGFDRVMVYRFDHRDNGRVIAESVREGLESYLDLHYPASDIPSQARRLYLLNRLRLIVDVAYQPVPIEPPLSPVTGEPLDLTYSVLRSISPIHVEYLRNMGIHASMSVSLVVDGRLWGLLLCHHYAPRFVSYDVRAACDFLSQTLSWLITAGERSERLEQRARVDDRLRALIQHLSDADDLAAGLTLGAQDLLAIVDAGGAALVHAGRTTAFGAPPPPRVVEALARWLRSRDDRGFFNTERLASQTTAAAGYVEVAAGLLAVPLDRAGESHLLWFRPGVELTVNWAGDPNKTASLKDGAPRLSPRGSFALWKETIQGGSLPWQPWQVEIAVELGHAIGAIVLRRAAVLEALNHELRATTEELKRANLAKDDFLATLSHELRTPLSAMLGWIRLARTNQLDQERMAHALDVIERNAKTQAKLIEDLLDVSRIISGKMRLDVQAINLLDVARAALDSIRPSAEAKSISIHSVLDPGASIIMGDPARLQQVAWNLLSNAVKFTGKEGHVHLHLTRAESSAAITVSDDGEGIDAAFLPHVFDRFRQAYGGVDRIHQGLGLGLAIVRHLVELHGGSVSAFSQGKGRGAVFTVHLPLSPLRADQAEVPANGALAAGGVDCPPHLLGLRILVVDDEPDARELLLAELSRCGAVVQMVETAAEALERISAWLPDALISDIGLPEMDGYMLIKAIRQLPKEQGGRTPAVALTAYASSQDRSRAFLAGFQAHLAKPIELQELLAVLASISGRIGS